MNLLQYINGVRREKSICFVYLHSWNLFSCDKDGAVEDKTTVKVHNMHTEQNEKAIRYVASNMIKEDPKIAITFDDGPSPAWTPQLLDGLKERNVKATFF